MSALSARLPLLLTLLLAIAMVAALGWQGYQTWQQEQQPLSTAAGAPVASEPVSQIPDISVAEIELFGSANPAAQPREQETENLPDTNLRLVLRGVMAADGDFPGSALIEDASGDTDAYLVGSELPGNVTLRSVHPNRVIIDRSGRLENLKFPELTESEGLDVTASDNGDSQDSAPTSSYPTASGPSSSPPVVTTPAASEQRRTEIRQRLEELRQRLRNNSN